MNPYISKLRKALFGYNTALKLLFQSASRIALKAMLRTDFIPRFTGLLLTPESTLLVICVFFLGRQCVAREVDVPSGRGSGSVVTPSGWVELITPVRAQVDLKFYSF